MCRFLQYFVYLSVCLLLSCFQGLLLAGGFDCALRGWVLLAGDWASLFCLGAGIVHAHPILAVCSASGTERAASLDESGKMAWYY